MDNLNQNVKILDRNRDMAKSAPVIAFAYVCNALYHQVLDRGVDAPFLCMPLGLMYLSATLKQRTESDVFLIDYTVAASNLRNDLVNNARDMDEYREGPDRFLNETALAAAKGRVPDVIAVSVVFSTSLPTAIQIIEHLSRLWPDAIVVVGGNHATNDVPFLLSHRDVDYVCRGEADWALPEFVNALAKTDKPEVKGFYSRDDIAEGKPVSESCDYPEDLDEIPFPDWDLIDVDAYQNTKMNHSVDMWSREDARYFLILTSRGCFYKCTFCASHLVHGRKLRLRSVENVLAEMREIYDRFGISLFIPQDDLFIGDKKHSLALLAGIKGLNIPNLEMQFPSALAVNTLDEEVINAMCEAGMRIFSLAIESGSPYTQQYLIKKRVNLERARRLVKYANDRNLYTRVNWVIGFPHEKMEHIQETIDYMKTLDADWNIVNLATPLLGSEMFEQFLDMGVIDFESRNWMNSYLKRDFDTEDFKAKELEEIAYYLNLEVNFLHNRQMRLGDWELALQVFKNVAEKHHFHIVAHYQILLCLENLGRHEDAHNRIAHIHHLVSTLNSSKEMLRKVADMFPDMVERLKQFESKYAR